MKKEEVVDYKTILATVVGGLGLLAGTVFLSSFLSSPPSRAEFDSLKTEILVTQKSIDDRLTNIENSQTTILEHLLGTKKGN